MKLHQATRYFFHLLIYIILLPLFACQKSEQKIIDSDQNSYIKDFELIQKNSLNDTTIKITSPNATIDQTTSDIEILNSNIKILNNKSNSIEIKSGKSTLNNSNNLIRVYNNVYISLLDNKDSYITTDSFEWDLNTSNMTLNSPLNINFKDTKIFSKYGSYNVNLNNLVLNESIFKREIYNIKAKEQYEIQITSDIIKWFKKDNILEFISDDNQVETTINFLSIE